MRNNRNKSASPDARGAIQPSAPLKPDPSSLRMLIIAGIGGVLLMTALASATSTRLTGMNGKYWVPDRETDIGFNPAYLLRFNGLEALGQNLFQSVDQNTKNINSRVAGGTNVSSELRQGNFFSQLGLQYGVLGKIGKTFGVGAFWSPMLVSLDQNAYIRTNKAGVAGERESDLGGAASGYTVFQALAGLDLGNLKLGLSGLYGSVPIELESSLKTNGIVNASQGSKQSQDSSGAEIRAGSLLSLGKIELGLTVGLELTTSLDKLFAYYDWNQDDHWARDESSGTTFDVNVNCTAPLGPRSLRAVLITGFGSELTRNRVYDENATEIFFGAGTYAVKKNEEYKTETSDTALELYVSILDTLNARGTGFCGLKFGYSDSLQVDSRDTNINIAPTGAGQQYEDSTRASAFSIGLGYGLEASIAPRVVLRGGISGTLLSFAWDSYTRTEAWDQTTATVSSVESRAWERTTTFYLDSLTLTGGLTWNLSERFFIDVSGGTVLGLGIASIDETGYKTKDKTAYRSNPFEGTQNSVTFVLNCSLTCRL